jgi:hypothetical protein
MPDRSGRLVRMPSTHAIARERINMSRELFVPIGICGCIVWARQHLAIALIPAYIPQIDIWPDDWAASPFHLKARTFQTLSPRSTNRDNGHENLVRQVPRAHRQ